MSDPIVELQGQVFRALDDLCSGLTADEWAKPTDCPGWDVKDNLSHIVGTESSILGRPGPEHDPGEKEWVKNPIGAGNEIHVDYRRSWTGAQVLKEFREVISERMEKLRAMSDEELAADSWTPIGPGTVRDLLAVRIMDCWVHEQDIRHAVGRPGGLDGPIAQHAFMRHSGALPFVIGKKVAPPDGTTVVFSVEGFGDVAIVKDGKRANLMDEAPESPTVKLSMDLDTFNRLCCGRGDPDEAMAKVRIDGDEDLGRQVLANQNFMV